MRLVERGPYHRRDPETENRSLFKLSREERKAILAGELTKLKRDGKKKPDVAAGEVQVIAWTRGGPQFIARSEKEREKLVEEDKPLTIDIPREPAVWIEFREPQLKDGEWETPFILHDERKPVRTLARSGAGAGSSSQAGLKTRWAETVNARGEVRPKRVPKRGEQTGSFTPDSERGYGGGKSAADEREAVDDAWLAEDVKRRRIEEESELKRKRKRLNEGRMRQEIRLAETRRRGMTETSAKIKKQLEEAAA
jgi:hypothetical protein